MTNPKTSGDGQNEFCFDDNNPGILEMTFKVKVTPASRAQLVANHANFTMNEGIGDSLKQWASGNENGKPTAAPDGSGTLQAKVTFTNLPSQNSGFGKRYVQLIADNGAKLTEKDGKFEVFFPRDERNHPGGDNGKTPNWFYYWKEGGVCGIPADAGFVDLNKHGTIQNGKVMLGNGAPDRGGQRVCRGASYGAQQWAAVNGVRSQHQTFGLAFLLR